MRNVKDQLPEEPPYDFDAGELEKYKGNIHPHDIFVAAGDLPIVSQLQLARMMATNNPRAGIYNSGSDPGLILAVELLDRVI